jgi:hypothetical protein
MIVRSIDGNNDWNFGRGLASYRRDQDAVAQNIKTRLQSFLNDCFFAADQGIDWFNLLGSKNEVGLKLSIASVILNTRFVINLEELSVTINQDRSFSIFYKVKTAVEEGTIALAREVSYILTESGDFLTTEDGAKLYF